MKISIIAFTDNGMKIAKRLSNSLNNSQDSEIDFSRCKKGELYSWTEEKFHKNDALIFIGAIGIAIRAIAPLIQRKTKDPAVVVVDELGQYSIPILSGHIGGANELANKIAKTLNTIPVITTATDINNVFAIDTWAKSQGLKIFNPQNIKLISSKLLKREKIHIKSDYPIEGYLPKNIKINQAKNDESYDVIISHKTFNYKNKKNEKTLFLIPPIITVGIGCRKNIDYKIIKKSVLNTLKKENIHILALKDIASIDKKADEKGIIKFAKEYDLPFKTYSSDELNSIKGDFTKSEFVKSVVEVDNVCERSAVIQSKGNLIRRKDANEGVTIALAIKEPKLNW